MGNFDRCGLLQAVQEAPSGVWSHPPFAAGTSRRCGSIRAA
jgi:hypothetical protein